MGPVVTSIFGEHPWIEAEFGSRVTVSHQDAMASLSQIHSAAVFVADQIGRVGEGDGLLTATPGVAVSIRTADCFPILLADVHRRAVAAVHAGWRGTAAKIVPAAIEMMRERFDTRVSNIYAAIGPGIGKCCYRVGEDVGRKFGLEGAGYIDLGEANRDQLMEAGVPRDQIERIGLCTFCNPERFHSYRRDGDTAGRMVSFIRIRPNG